MRAKRLVTVPLQPYFGFHWEVSRQQKGPDNSPKLRKKKDFATTFLCQPPNASVQRARSTLPGHFAISRGTNVKWMNANRAIQVAAQQLQGLWGPISVYCQRTLVIRIAVITLASDSAITIARLRPSKGLVLQGVKNKAIYHWRRNYYEHSQKHFCTIRGHHTWQCGVSRQNGRCERVLYFMGREV